MVYIKFLALKLATGILEYTSEDFENLPEKEIQMIKSKSNEVLEILDNNKNKCKKCYKSPICKYLSKENKYCLKCVIPNA